nr:extracellular solute-binding protein [Clostridia bacterium]
MTKNKKLLIALAVVAVVVIALIVLLSGGEKPMYAVPGTSQGNAREAGYQAYLDENGFDGALSTAVVSVDVFSGVPDETATTSVFPDVENINYTEMAIDDEAVWSISALNTSDVGSVTWTFTVEEEGFYNLQIGYVALPGTTSDVQRKVLIDGEAPYDALEQIVFKRLWRDEDIRLKNGNEIRPNAIEIMREQVVFLEDYDRRSGAPLILHLTAGEHTLTFEAVKEPLAISSLTFMAAPELPSYADVSAQWADVAAYQGEVIVGQAERRGYSDATDEDGEPLHTPLSIANATTDVIKTSPAVTVQKNYSDAALTPFHAWHILYPTIGASSWDRPGDAITWEIEVPEAGLYVLTFKGRQTSRGVTSYRRLMVNGEVPYAEAEVVGFDYAGTMQNYTFADKDGNPYLVHLNAGKNTITLECVLGSIGGVVAEVEESLRTLNALYLATIQITGNVPSQFIDYEIAKKIPNFVDTMTAESQRLFRLVDKMVEITGEKGENTAMLEKMAIQAEGLADDPENIVKELSQLKNNISALGTWISNISSMPLELDAVILSVDTASLPEPNESWLAGIVAEVQRFWATFFHSTSTVVSDEDGEKKSTEIVVWMASAGREQAQIIQNMIDETFSPNHDISVRLQLIPMDVVLRAALAGNGPDVVIGLNQTTAQDFAMRGATVDLSRMEGFDEYVSRYSEGVMRATTYNDGSYGIPEQVNFQMFFYREDVMEELGIENVPETWTEVMEIIPVLNRENYEFYMPSTRVATGLNIFMSMVYQNDGEIYLGTEGENGTYGVASALYSDEAMEAFKWYTDLFTVHGLEVQADFNNRFRTGEMPMGVTDYTTYCTLEIFAPEIKGLWSFSPLPGTEQADGTIDNTYVCDTVQTVMMQGADDYDAAWTFIQWWNDTEQQLSYATTLEAVMGAAARYPAADPLVIEQLPWSNYEKEQLLAQYESLASMPAVPGYYMNTRMISYAFEDVVADLANPRETLYLNIRDIDKELTKKREEFDLPTTLSSTEPLEAANEE